MGFFTGNSSNIWNMHNTEPQQATSLRRRWSFNCFSTLHYIVKKRTAMSCLAVCLLVVHSVLNTSRFDFLVLTKSLRQFCCHAVEILSHSLLDKRISSHTQSHNANWCKSDDFPSENSILHFLLLSIKINTFRKWLFPSGLSIPMAFENDEI